MSHDRIVLLWSGGKDAALALDVLVEASPPPEVLLLTTVVDAIDVVTTHGTPLALIEAQADAMGRTVHVMRVPPQPSNATYETRLERALAPLQASGVHTVAAGDLHLDDIRAYREGLLEAMGVTPLFPIWGRDPDVMARRFLERGYRAVVTSVDTTQLDASFAGRRYDADFLDALPSDVDPCGENGEFHTFVTFGPGFDHAVDVRVVETHGTGRMRYARLEVRGAER